MSEEEKNKLEKKTAAKKPRKKLVIEEKSSQKEKLPEDLTMKLTEAVRGLLYTSEIDASFESFAFKRTDKTLTDISADEILRFVGGASDAKIEEKSFDDFFARLIEIQDWYEEEEKKQVEKFGKLKETISTNLKNVKVFRVGETQIDIYIIGVDADGNLAGVKTKAVET